MPNKWIMVRYINKPLDKTNVKLYRKVKKQLLEIFPLFQQFKIEIRKNETWVMDWEELIPVKSR